MTALLLLVVTIGLLQRRWGQQEVSVSPERDIVWSKRLAAADRKVQLPVAPDLPPKVLNEIRGFVFFIGYARSGHSILGSIMDAHPHVVISNEFFIFKKFPELNRVPDNSWRDNLFNLVYQKSFRDLVRSRENDRKGYTLTIEGLWQGRYEDHIEVIGDKSGGMTTLFYRANRTNFMHNYKKLKKMISVPIKIIHAVRNPYDIISTKIIAGSTRNFRSVANRSSLDNDSGRWSNFDKLDVEVDRIQRVTYALFRQIKAVKELIEVFGIENVHNVHNCDLVNDPIGTISSIFDFIGVNMTEHFLRTCASKVFKSVSRSRDLINWTSQQREVVEKNMRKYEVLSRYSFTSD